MLGRERGWEELLDSFGRWSFGVPSNYSWAPDGGGMPLAFPRVTLCALGIQTCSLVRCGGKKKIKTVLVQRELVRAAMNSAPGFPGKIGASCG